MRADIAEDGTVLNEPTIAVIVPNRNDARYLPRCLHSVLDQMEGPNELIVVDDQSTDESVAVIRSLIAGDPRAQLVEHPINLGTNGAIHEGLRRTRCDYVLFLSANDFVLPGIFARAKHCLARSPAAGLWSAMAWLVDEEDRPLRLHPSPVVALKDAFFPPEHCLQLARRLGNWFIGTALIYHRDTLNAAGGFDPGYEGFSDFVTSLVVASLRGAAYTPEPFGAFRIHPGSFSTRTFSDVGRLEAMLQRLTVRGPRLASRLFDKPFLDRTALRFRFAAVRATGGAAIAEVAARVAGRRRSTLLLVDRLLPAGLRMLRVALAFLILRPFDILPTLWNRMLGWAFVRLRVKLRGRELPMRRRT